MQFPLYTEAVVQRCSVKKLRLATLFIERLWHLSFPVNFVKFLRTPFFIEHRRWLLLYTVEILPSKQMFISLRPATLLKERRWHRCFPVNFVKFLRTPFLQNTSGQLLLFFQPNRLSDWGPGELFFLKHNYMNSENILWLCKHLSPMQQFDNLKITGCLYQK